MTELTGWTPEQERELRKLWHESGLTNRQIATKIGRNYAQTKGKLHRMGLVGPEKGKGWTHEDEPQPIRKFIQAAAVIFGVSLEDIQKTGWNGERKSAAPLARRALVYAAGPHLSRRVIADALGLKYSSVTAMYAARRQYPEALISAGKIEAVALGLPAPEEPKPEPEAPAKPRYHPGYSVVTSSGITIRRCPDTGEILFHERDRSAFAHLIGGAS